MNAPAGSFSVVMVVAQMYNCLVYVMGYDLYAGCEDAYSVGGRLRHRWLPQTWWTFARFGELLLCTGYEGVHLLRWY